VPNNLYPYAHYTSSHPRGSCLDADHRGNLRSSNACIMCVAVRQTVVSGYVSLCRDCMVCTWCDHVKAGYWQEQGSCLYSVFLFGKTNWRLSFVIFPAGRVRNCWNAFLHARSLDHKACRRGLVVFRCDPSLTDPGVAISLMVATPNTLNIYG